MQSLRRLSAPERFADSLRVLLAMGSVMLVTGNQPHVMIALQLGVIAAALAETDDGWKQRLAALVGTLVCFTVAAFAVELLFNLHWLFALVLAVGSFALVMLGAASSRYATITNATLLLAVYTMIGMDQHGAAQNPIWREPLLLVAGAAWYGVLAIAWSALFVQHPVRLALGRVYDALAGYMQAKAQLFEPLRDLPVAERRAELAQQNAAVVDALNSCRLVLIDRLDRRRPRASLERALQLYLAAQDIHERASSSHYPYQTLAQAFFHSDVMFRCQRAMQQLAASCRDRAEAVRVGADYHDSGHAEAAIADLREALAQLSYTHAEAPHDLRLALQRLGQNLTRLNSAIQGAEKASAETADRALQNPSPRGPREVLRRTFMQMTPTSTRFRHALRLGLAMLAGYGLLRLVHPDQGYWILLTVMLVCQPNFGATRTRLVQRVTGTVAGLLAGWALLKLFPAEHMQLALTVAVGVLFFVARYRQYLLASAAVTVFVLLAFNQIGNGFDLILPRFLDTVLGGVVAVAATFLVLPDWRERELRLLFAETLDADARYLRQIVTQYTTGKRDDLAYRVARRDAHNADATLSGHLTSALADPFGQRIEPERALRLLAACQELIGHLSTLGAHRQNLPDHGLNAALIDNGEAIAQQLQTMAHTLRTRGLPDPAHRGEAPGQAPLGDDGPMLVEQDTGEEVHRLVAAQMRLLQSQLPTLAALSATLAQRRD
ncbi:TIGR01666 family membrane protein [Oleiagrimonas sp. C23AA]|nr:YccS family putative transporter [Oleiagrimonas sp. C23AA]NII09459.1 TIGR01666 family membrane protein [Oleiagrimonas sp. C23AA]